MDARKWYASLNERRQGSVQINTRNLMQCGYCKGDAFLKALQMDKRLFDRLESDRRKRETKSNGSEGDRQGGLF